MFLRSSIKTVCNWHLVVFASYTQGGNEKESDLICTTSSLMSNVIVASIVSACYKNGLIWRVNNSVWMSYSKNQRVLAIKFRSWSNLSLMIMMIGVLETRNRYHLKYSCQNLIYSASNSNLNSWKKIKVESNVCSKAKFWCFVSAVEQYKYLLFDWRLNLSEDVLLSLGT